MPAGELLKKDINPFYMNSLKSKIRNNREFEIRASDNAFHKIKVIPFKKFLNKDQASKKVVYNFEDDTFLSGQFELKNNEKINYTLTIKPDKARNVEEVIKGLKLYRAFQQKKFIIDGKSNFFNENNVNKSNIDLEILNMTIAYWERIRELENVLGIDFKPSAIMKDKSNPYFDKLYVSLVKNKAYRQNMKSAEVTATVSLEDNIDDFKKKSDFSFTFTQEEKIKLWGHNFTLYATIGMFNLKLLELTKEMSRQQKKAKLKLKVDFEKEQRSYQSTRFFKSFKEAKKFVDNYDELSNADFLDNIMENINKDEESK